MFTLSPTKDLLLILLIVLLIFGPKRLPGLGKQLGQGLREFKESITGGDSDSADSEPAQIAKTGVTSAPGAVTAEQRPAENTLANAPAQNAPAERTPAEPRP
jgi:sec-independent protein translocase protein TatA